MSSENLQGMHWALKRTFIDYVRKMPDGQTGIGAGAVATGEYEVVYPIVQGGRRMVSDDVEETIWEFGGDIQFKGHYGMLYVRIASPVVFIRNGVGNLSIADPQAGGSGKRRILADLTLERQQDANGLEVWTSADIRLHPEAVDMFGDVYPPGEPFEQLTIVSPPFGEQPGDGAQ